MGEKIVVGPLTKGLRTDVTPFNIDNDSFPLLINAYQWRGRVKRKRGTSLLGRLTRFFSSTVGSYNTGSTTITLSGGGVGNLLTGFSLQTNGNIVPGSVTITIGANTYTDPSKNGTLSGPHAGTINYATGVITIVAEAGNAASAVFNYYPDLPVMGIEDLILNANQFPGTLAFDTTYSYNVVNSSPYSIYDVSFYKNPPTATYVGYTQKSVVTPTSWNGQNYQQIWTVNNEGALWASNGITFPFTNTNIGMQFKPIVATMAGALGPPATVNLQITSHGLSVGDFLFINEVPPPTTGINFQTGYVTVVVDANSVTVEFPQAVITGNSVGGIAQYLTNRSDITKDCLRWYDGDPTNGNATNPTLNGNSGWVNFAPPLSQASFSISELPAAQYYLVGARMIVPFKDRLLFIGPVVQTSSSGSQRYLQDTIIYSQNGTPYYTCSFNGSTAINASTVFTAVLVPNNQTATCNAYWGDVTGLGGFISAGYSQPINTVSTNEDALILGFNNIQTRVIYSGNDIIPFNFFQVNSELGSASTFSVINFDRGVLTIGHQGIIQSAQVGAQRIDLEIPDQVFEFTATNNGSARVTAQRDYINEWVYFSYPSNRANSAVYIYPTQTLQYNYRDTSWAIFNETYTTYGQFRKSTGKTWATIGTIFPTWAQWNEPWNAGSTTLLQQQILAGNQQGFLLIRESGTAEGNSLYIQSFSGSTITSPDHCLFNGDYIVITGCTGTVSSSVNGKTFQVNSATQNTFGIGPNIPSGTYFGSGVIQRLYIPNIQTKQFPVSWSMGRKTRIGAQQYLLTTTANGQIELQIYLSQNANSPYNFGPVVPAPNSANNSLIYSDTLYTCPESTNLGLTPANTNLQMLTAPDQAQTWHRMNTSLLGDTVQIGFTMSNAQMTSLTAASAPATITAATQAYPCVLTCTNSFSPGLLVTIAGVVGMSQLNGNVYIVTASSSSSLTIDVDATAFTAYISGGTATQVANFNQTAEIELHSMVLDVSPSQVLA
jgi:hypothetical protein